MISPTAVCHSLNSFRMASGGSGGSRPLRRLAASPNLVAKDQCDTHGERVEIERSELPQPNGQLNLLRCEVNFG